jgi:hypothetical protein
MRRAGLDAETAARVCHVLAEPTEHKKAASNAACSARPTILSESTAAQELVRRLRRS